MPSALSAPHRGSRRARPRLARATSVTLAFALLASWLSSTAQAADRLGNRDAAEREVLVRINQIRVRYGLGELHASRALTFAANVHSQDMARRRYFGHNTLQGGAWNLRLRSFVRARVVGETLDLLYGPASRDDDPKTVVTDWLRSPPHRAVLLGSSLHRIGVAHASMPGGRPAFFTADFAS